MASQHHFSDRLRNQLNDANARNLELQALLAQRDDSLAACSTRLQNAISAASNTGVPNSFLHNELHLAQEDADRLETRLSHMLADFNKERSKWKHDIENLQREVAVRDSVLSDANLCLAAELERSSTVTEVQVELARIKLELKKMKQYATGIQKQFEAEKKDNSSRFPATAAGKACTDIDQDDEETGDDAIRIKQETASGVRHRQPALLSRSSQQVQESSFSELNTSPPSNLQYRGVPARVIKSRQAEPSVPSLWKHRSRAKQSKRKRSWFDNEDADYDDLEIDMDDSGGSGASQRSKVIRGIEIEHVKQTCDFKAITNYDDDGDKLYLDSKQDLSDVCPDLWERIQSQHEAWERACGEDWQYDLESKYTYSALAKPGVKPPCVTTKLLKINNGRSMWHDGYEGKYACRACAREKRPCFTWDGEELYLLPLHEQDRTYPEEDGFEIRTWLDVE